MERGIQMNATLQWLTGQEIERIHRATMRILEEGGIEFQLPKALDVFKKHGFRVNGSKVFFTEQQVLDAIKTTPRKFTLLARDRDKSVEIGGGIPVMDSGDGYVSIDSKKGRRPAQLRDTLNHVKLVHTAGDVQINGGNMITPTDVTGGIGLAHTILLGWYLSDKPMKSMGFGPEYVKVSLDMARIALGADVVKENYVCLGFHNPTSPLTWIQEVLECLFLLAEAGQPIEIAPAGMLGTTSSATDMRTMVLAMGAPEGAMMAAALTQVLHHYGLPVRGGGPLTDARVCDYQAGVESTLNLLVPMLSHTDLIFHMGGMCDGYGSFSFEKCMLDEELLAICRRCCRKIETDEASLAVDHLLNITGGDGNFLADPYTLNRFRTEVWQPELFNRMGYEQWQEAGAITLEEGARKKWHERVENFEMPHLDESTGKAMWKYVADNYGTLDWLTAETCKNPLFVDPQ
jgi:trimethylamine---corrinoid protein Co-methyltransferase